MEFKIGDKVSLVSGGPSMTINEEVQQGKYECVWFEKNEPKYHEFKAEVLRKEILPEIISFTR